MSLPTYDPLAWERDCTVEELYNLYAHTGWRGYRLRNVGAVYMAITELQATTVLDTGCFIGMYSQPISAANVTYVGTDVTPKFIEKAKELQPDLRFEVADVRELPFRDGEFDIVLCFGTLIHLDSVAGAIAELWRVTNQSLLIEATTHNEAMHIVEIPNESPSFIHRAYSPSCLLDEIKLATGQGACLISRVATYSGLHSTLLRVDK